MKKKAKNTDQAIDEIQAASDFLLNPDDLVLEEETIRVSLNLTKKTVEGFKRLAKKHNTKYQRLIRRLLDEYASRHSL